MMCTQLNDRLIEVANGYASKETVEQVNKHLATCSACTFEMERLVQLTSSVSSTQDPGPEFWDTYFEKLETRIVESDVSQPRFTTEKNSRPSLLRLVPTWSLHAAAAIAILVTGIFLGKSFFAQPESPSIVSAPPTELENQALSYLDRSKTLLLGLANFNPQEDDPSELNIERRKSLAGGLIQEASLLKTELSKADQDRLSDLIADLEVILLQIANIETEYDIPEIEMVKNGVDRKAIFFKIDVENMLRSSGEPQPETSTKRPRHSAI